MTTDPTKDTTMTRLFGALLAAMLLCLVPTAVAAADGAVGAVVAADDEDLQYGDTPGGEDDHGDEGHGDDHGGEMVNMDNGGPQEAGAQALAGAQGSGMATVLMVGAGVVVLVLMIGGLVRGRGANA